jgi:hypothetical protein
LKDIEIYAIIKILQIRSDLQRRIFMGIFSRFRKNEQKNNSESVSLSPKEKFKKMVPANPGIALNDDEVCLFMSDASIGKEKTHTTGYKSSGISSRIRIAKGLSVGSSNVHVTPTRETYWEKTPCRFFVTDKRFIAISQKGGFNLKADKIIDMKLNADAVTLYTGSKTYIVFMTSEDVHRYKDLWETIQNLQRNGIDPKKLLR